MFGYRIAVAGVSPGMLWVTAVLAGLVCAVHEARRNRLDPRTMYLGGIVVIFFGLWGARLLGMVYYATDGRQWAWLRFWSGGLAQYGAFFGGGLAFLVFLILRRLPILAYFDAVAPAMALTVAIGRVGCFLNGDDFGTQSHLPWAVQFPPGTEAYADHLSRGWIAPGSSWSLPVHPVQLYATLFWLALFVVLNSWHPSLHGLRFSLLLVAHGAGRIVEQLFRGDFRPVLGPFSLTQIISFLFVAIGAGVLWLQLWGRRRAVDPINVCEEVVRPHTCRYSSLGLTSSGSN